MLDLFGVLAAAEQADGAEIGDAGAHRLADAAGLLGGALELLGRAPR